jgi:uncharacterized protein HemX
MPNDDQETKTRNREIARNESERQITGDIRVSGWAIAAAVVLGLAAVGWILVHKTLRLRRRTTATAGSRSRRSQRP